MPAVDESTGQPISDDPDQENADLAGAKGKGQFVDANSGPDKHSSIETGPDNQREAERSGAADEGDDPMGANATGGA